MIRGTFIECCADPLIGVIRSSAVCVMDHNEILQVDKGIYDNNVAERIGSMATSVAGDNYFYGASAGLLGADYGKIPP